MEISSSTALVLFTIGFTVFALAITFAGVWVSLKYPEQVDGWSDGIAFICLSFMAIVTLYAMNKLQEIFFIPDFGDFYTGLVIGYFVLFVVVQPRIVQYFRRQT